MLPGLETRVLDLKNHFPVAMRLLSLVMEDCQDILSVTGVDPTTAASVALPQASWEGISISFRRSATVSSVGVGGSFNGSGTGTLSGVSVGVGG
ncbi:unnamed protein product, partial [Laminaria digitata]